MRRLGLRIVQAIAFVLFAVLFAALFSLLVMSLWNWLMPDLFGLKTITYLQALGLLFLCRLLLGRLGGRPRPYWRHRLRERWERMSPEERERFRAGLRARCGRVEEPDGKTTTA